MASAEYTYAWKKRTSSKIEARDYTWDTDEGIFCKFVRESLLKLEKYNTIKGAVQKFYTYSYNKLSLKFQ